MSRMVTAPDRAREYETIYILRPDIDSDNAERIGSKIVEIMGKEKGRLTKVETWGRRKLAYKIAKHSRGIFIYLKYLGHGPLVLEIERNLKLFDGVLKYQTVLLQNNVSANDIAPNEEDVQFEKLETASAEELAEPSQEQILGLVESEHRHSHFHHAQPAASSEVEAKSSEASENNQAVQEKST